MATITTKDGTRIYYKDWGTGQPIVFSHGWLLSADDWDGQMLFFGQKGFRVIAHDRRGHGRSSHTGFYFLWAPIAQLCETSVDSGISNCAVTSPALSSFTVMTTVWPPSIFFSASFGMETEFLSAPGDHSSFFSFPLSTR